MPYIYKITNKINGKVYIGKTMKTINERWSEHRHDYKKDRNENRPLYRAMSKYGLENFYIEEVESCTPETLSEREIYWIEHFNSFKTGYNATIGGDGTLSINYDEVVATYLRLGNQNKTAKALGVHPDSIKLILDAKGITCISSAEINKKQKGVKVQMFSNTGEYIQTFETARDAARFVLGEKEYASITGPVAHILDVCRGKRKTAYKYKWSFAPTEAA